MAEGKNAMAVGLWRHLFDFVDMAVVLVHSAVACRTAGNANAVVVAVVAGADRVTVVPSSVRPAVEESQRRAGPLLPVWMESNTLYHC